MAVKLIPIRRGRPQKFGRPSRAVTLTLPEDVIAALSGIDDDLSRAVVELSRPLAADVIARPVAELAKYGDSAVIVIKPLVSLGRIPGVTHVPLPDGRALISLDESMTVYEFELKLRDLIDVDKTIDDRERAALKTISGILRSARQTKGLTVHQRSIIVLQSNKHRRIAGQFLSLLFSAVTLAACSSASTPTQPTPPAPPVVPTLTAPANDQPPDDQQLDTIQPQLQISNGTSTPTGTRTYEFQVASGDDFTASAVVASAQNVAEGATGKTSWTVSSALSPTTRYWWRARAVQASTAGPWSAATRFRSKLEGYNRPGALFDPLTTGVTVGNPSNVAFESEGARFNALTSLITYQLPQALPEGEFSMEVTGLTTNSPGDKTKVFSMQQGFDDLTENVFRATVEKRSNGEISFRFIAGNPDERADADRVFLSFDPATTYFWRLTWGNRQARLVIIETTGAGRVLFDQTDSYGGTYTPSPHIAYIGAPSGRSGPTAASVPGMRVKNVWLSNAPRPTF